MLSSCSVAPLCSLLIVVRVISVSAKDFYINQENGVQNVNSEYSVNQPIPMITGSGRMPIIDHKSHWSRNQHQFSEEAMSSNYEVSWTEPVARSHDGYTREIQMKPNSEESNEDDSGEEYEPEYGARKGTSQKVENEKSKVENEEKKEVYEDPWHVKEKEAEEGKEKEEKEKYEVKKADNLRKDNQKQVQKDSNEMEKKYEHHHHYHHHDRNHDNWNDNLSKEKEKKKSPEQEPEEGEKKQNYKENKEEYKDEKYLDNKKNYDNKMEYDDADQNYSKEKEDADQNYSKEKEDADQNYSKEKEDADQNYSKEKEDAEYSNHHHHHPPPPPPSHPPHLPPPPPKKEKDHWYEAKYDNKYKGKYNPKKEYTKEEEKKEYYDYNTRNNYDDIEKPEQIGWKPGDKQPKTKEGKSGFLESYFWKAIPGWENNKDSKYNYIVHVSKIKLDRKDNDNKNYY